MSEKLMNEQVEIIGPEDIPQKKISKPLPIIIEDSFDSLTKINAQIKKAEASANEAKEAASNAFEKKVGLWSRTTPTLEALQKAGKCQSEALIEVTKCQELLFKQQEVLAECSELLFWCCCANSAQAEIAVKEIKARLEGASQEEISSIAKIELQKTVQRLTQQIDILTQQEKIKNKVKNFEEELHHKELVINQQNYKISAIEDILNQYCLDNESVINQQNYKISAIEDILNQYCLDSESKDKRKKKETYVLQALFLGMLVVYAITLIWVFSAKGL